MGVSTVRVTALMLLRSAGVLVAGARMTGVASVVLDVLLLLFQILRRALWRLLRVLRRPDGSLVLVTMRTSYLVVAVGCPISS